MDPWESSGRTDLYAQTGPANRRILVTIRLRERKEKRGCALFLRCVRPLRDKCGMCAWQILAEHFAACSFSRRNRFLQLGLRLLASLALLALPGGCRRAESDRLQGYVEGEYVYVASPLAGALQKLNVQRGDRVPAGDPLFALDDTPE